MLKVVYTIDDGKGNVNEITQQQALNWGLEVSPIEDWYWEFYEEEENCEEGFEPYSEHLDRHMDNLMYNDDLSNDDAEDTGLHRIHVWCCYAGNLFIPFKRHFKKTNVDFYVEVI